MIVLLIGLVALADGRANAQGNYRNEIIIESLSWGMSTGETARVSGVNFLFGDGAVRTNDPVIMRVQLLDAEGEVIAQSDEIRIEPNKIGYWGAPREMLPAGELTGRIQVRARIFAVFVTTAPFDVNRDRPPFALTVELIDSGTGRTNVYLNPKGFQIISAGK
jgi:prepilin-type processing-associated H-X9-DG protein